MMQPRKALRQRALLKAQPAYGDSVQADLRKAIAHLLGRPGRLERCMLALQMTLPKAQLWQRIKALEAR